MQRKPILEIQPSQKEKEIAQLKAIPVAVKYIPQSQEVIVHEVRANDPDRLAEINAGIGVTALNPAARTEVDNILEASIQADWDRFAARKD